MQIICVTRCHSHAPVLSSSFRQQLSKAMFDSPPISPKTPASAVKCRTPRVQGQKCSSSVLSSFFQKKPKSSPSKAACQDGSSSLCVQRGKRQTANTRDANEADLHSAPTLPSVAVKEEPLDVEEPPVQDLKPVKVEDACTYSVSSGAETAHCSSPAEDVKPVIKGVTPVYMNFYHRHLPA